MPRALKEEEGKRYALAARTSLELNRALKEAAKASGRSVAQEVELRLELSFAREKHEIEVEKSSIQGAIDKKTRSFLLTLEGAIGAAMLHAGASWVDDGYARASVKAAIDAVRIKFFQENPLNVSYSDIDIERLNSADKMGKFFGTMLATSAISDQGTDTVEGIVKAALDLQQRKDLDSSHPTKSKLRQNVSLDELNGLEPA